MQLQVAAQRRMRQVLTDEVPQPEGVRHGPFPITGTWMAGAADPLYVLARKVLLDALSALDAHVDALVLVGAQAVYVHTGDAELAVAEYTSDGDLAVSPSELAGQRLIHELLRESDWSHGDQPGRWTSREGVYVNLLVPEALAGPGS